MSPSFLLSIFSTDPIVVYFGVVFFDTVWAEAALRLVLPGHLFTAEAPNHVPVRLAEFIEGFVPVFVKGELAAHGLGSFFSVLTAIA
jgi:hypothetical protein